MSRWASGVTVVTCRGERGPHGMTASSFTGVSLNPPLVLVCVELSAHTHRMIERERAFGVNILREDMQALSSRCAGFEGEERHWLADHPTRVEVTGAPILEDALAWMDCSLWRAYEGGDHTIYVGEIQAGGCDPTAGPLLWFSRGYRRLGE